MSANRKHGFYFYRAMLVVMIFAISLPGILMAVRYNLQYDRQMEAVKASQKMVHAYQIKLVEDRLDNVLEDAVYLSRLEGLADVVRTGTMPEAMRQLLEQDSGYMMVTLLDVEGNVRLQMDFSTESDHEDGHEHDLTTIQRAIDELKTLPADGILIRQFSAQIRKPDQPILNFSVSVNEGDQVVGYLTVHLNHDNLFSDLHAAVSEQGHEALMVVDHNGYFYHDEMESTFSGTLGDRFAFPGMVPLEDLNGTTFQFDRSGLLTLSPLRFGMDDERVVIHSGTVGYVLVSHIPYDYFMQMSTNLFNDQLIPGFLLVVLLALLGYFISSKMETDYYNRELIRHYATYDELTGVYNRRTGFDFLSKLFQMCIRDQKPLSLAYYDINGLKSINDQCGHPAGDRAIRMIVDVVKESIRQSDSIIRMGGDEFLVILYECDKLNAERIFKGVEKKLEEMKSELKLPYDLSISTGIADSMEWESTTLDKMIHEVDRRMYKSKRRGRLDHLIGHLKK